MRALRCAPRRISGRFPSEGFVGASLPRRRCGSRGVCDVMLVEAGFAQQAEVARALGAPERTAGRHQQRHGRAGIVGLLDRRVGVAAGGGFPACAEQARAF